MSLTIYIPTYNRHSRLEKTLSDLIQEISQSKLQSRVKILVGDNASPDGTPIVLESAVAKALKLNVDLEYFRNDTNLGFSGNIFAGISKIASDWVMFLSDDDNLNSGSLTKVCRDLEEHQPSVALYNFEQYPYDANNPLIKKTGFTSGDSDYSLIATLFLWPKLTGVVLKSNHLNTRSIEVSEICSFSKHFPHVVLAAYLFLQERSLFKSKDFIAYPDADFLQHINFVPYIGEYLKRELEIYQDIFDKRNLSLQNQISMLSQSNILEQSINSLISYYRGQIPLNRNVKSTLESNIRQFIFFKKGTKDGLAFTRTSGLFYTKVFLLPFIAVTFRVLAKLNLHRIRLMDSAF